MLDLKLPELVFDESKHIYTVNGFTIPSVTQVMRPLNSDHYGSIDAAVLALAAAKGTAVHEAIEVHCKYGIDDIPEEYYSYFSAYLQWEKDYGPSILGSEVRFYHKTLRYAGTVDCVAEIAGRTCLIDFKTTQTILEKSCGVQLEAYMQGLKSHGITVQDKYILQLKKDGTYKFEKFPSRDAERWKVFTALLTLDNYLKK